MPLPAYDRLTAGPQPVSSASHRRRVGLILTCSGASMDEVSTPEAQLDLGVVAQFDHLGKRLQLSAAPAFDAVVGVDSGCLNCHVVAPIDSSAPVWRANVPGASADLTHTHNGIYLNGGPSLDSGRSWTTTYNSYTARRAAVRPNRYGSAVIEFPNATEVVFTRKFDAPIDLVFDVLTKPAHVRNWGATPPDKMTDCE